MAEAKKDDKDAQARCDDYMAGRRGRCDGHSVMLSAASDAAAAEWPTTPEMRATPPRACCAEEAAGQHLADATRFAPRVMRRLCRSAFKDICRGKRQEGA